MEPEVVNSEILLPPVLPFKRIQMSDKYPKGQARGRHWKHLKQILQAENYPAYSADEPNYINIESPPSMYPSKKFCDITGFELCARMSKMELLRHSGLEDVEDLAPYMDPRTSLRYASPDVFKRIRVLPNEYVQRHLSLRNAAVVLK